MTRSLVLGVLVFGFAAGCGGSQPADTGQTPETGADPQAGVPTVQGDPQTAQNFGGSSIIGTVTFAGTAPTLPPLTMNADPACAQMHSGPVANEMLALGSGNTLANIMVSVTEGLPAGRTWGVPAAPVTLDQNGCQYEPHVMGIMVGQTYRILNSDGVLHNIHTLPDLNRTFNRAMPATLTEVTTTFNTPEPMFQIKCDVHPWMSAYIGVFTHPFFSVTATDGQFTIAGLAAGTYEITAWHERLGMQTASVTIGADETQTQDFEFAVPAAN
jgi:plastocyanin